MIFQWGPGDIVADADWRARWVERGEFQAKTGQRAESSARTEEQRRQTAVEGLRADAKEQSQVAAVDAAGADVAGESAHNAADGLTVAAGNRTVDLGIARRGEAAGRAVIVLSDLLTWADARAGELTKAYDGARIAGLACELPILP
ncbi:DUF2514 family protein [Pseudomonas sp. R5(2019)]|uniref:DUF2514 family protein n=1 Tax=Pseudomonas sp. R5(2019) TaxID=2697566 RepID=UPI001412CDCE|nr:DUF2514 family protein [Pseudomonas sp. R5(2019)]